MVPNVETYPLLPLKNTVVFPFTSLFLVVGRQKSVAALRAAQAKDNLILVTAQKTQFANQEDIDPGNLYDLGTLCEIKNVVGSEKMAFQVLVTGLNRFKIHSIASKDQYLEASGEVSPDFSAEDDPHAQALFDNLKTLAKEILGLLPQAEESAQNLIENLEKDYELIYLWASHLNIPVPQKQELLERNDTRMKMEFLLELMRKEREVLLLGKDIQGKISQRLSEVQRKALLREQLRIIKEELGEGEKEVGQDLLSKIKEAQMPEEVFKVANEELSRMEGIHPTSAEYYVIRNYIEWLCAMPWNQSTREELDLKKVESVLDGQHYGLRKVKRRILEHLAVVKLRNNLKGPIICFLGPPGVGKTSLGKSIADAINRKFTRASLGGIKDESEIRGHRRTYVGAMPGRIAQGLKRVGVNNPLILLDEIDKMGVSFQGDPSSAILEVLDPEQNNSFVDNYLDVPFDLSRVFFVATANRLDTIPPPLRDRMEIMELTGYITDEKLQIAKRFILPKTLQDTGVPKEGLDLDDRCLTYLIEHYTWEAGVRELNRVISSLCRSVAYDLLHDVPTPIKINEQKITEYLGPKRFLAESFSRTQIPGVVKGLAWTPFGGEILYMECIAMPGNGKLHLTGQLGKVMKESGQIALSYVKSIKEKINPDFDFEKHDIHIHIPSGAIPKDGPSAGITLLASLGSMVSNKPVDSSLAMTGELTLSGVVLPVGGIKEKVAAAHRNKVVKIILPKENEKDLYDVPVHIKESIQFIWVQTVKEVLEKALDI